MEAAFCLDRRDFYQSVRCTYCNAYIRDVGTRTRDEAGEEHEIVYMF